VEKIRVKTVNAAENEMRAKIISANGNFRNFLIYID
jgi:hypothetical protein